MPGQHHRGPVRDAGTDVRGARRHGRIDREHDTPDGSRGRDPQDDIGGRTY